MTRVLHLSEAQGAQLGIAPARRGADPHKEKFERQIRAYQLPECLREHRFAKDIGRQWRFDWCFPQYMIAVEYEGLVMETLYRKEPTGRLTPVVVLRGGHATAGGFKKDREKYNAAAILGWFVLGIHRDSVKSDVAISTVIEALHSRGWRPPEGRT